MEIRIKVTNQEFADLEARSKGAGFPSVNAFARELMFPQHDYAIKWSEVKTYISNLKPGDTFMLTMLCLIPRHFSGVGFMSNKKTLALN